MLVVLLIAVLSCSACPVTHGFRIAKKSRAGSTIAPKDLDAHGESPPNVSEEESSISKTYNGKSKITIGAVGDVLLHESLQVQASQESLRHRHLWQPIYYLMQSVDVMYANLEVPLAYGMALKGFPKTTADAIATGGKGCIQTDDPFLSNGPRFDGKIYSGYPRFNADETLAQDLQLDGVDVVSTANNHAMDRCNRGINRTLAALKAVNVKYTGTIRKPGDRWSTVTQEKNISVAWLACTSAGSDAQKTWNRDSWAVLTCDDTNRISRIVKTLKNLNDAVIVLPHWGKEYGDGPSEFQWEQAHAWLNAGAVAVIGNHAHVTQEAQEFQTIDGRRTLIAFSLGNFVSHQGFRIDSRTTAALELRKRSSAFLFLGLSKSSNGATWLDSWKYVPLFVWRTEPEQCSGCKCPKPLGEYVSKDKRRCHKYRVMAADKSSSSSAQRALQNVQSLMGQNAYLTFDGAANWIKTRNCPSFARNTAPLDYNGREYCQCKFGALCFKGEGQSQHCIPISNEWFELSSNVTNCKCWRQHSIWRTWSEDQ